MCERFLLKRKILGTAVTWNRLKGIIISGKLKKGSWKTDITECPHSSQRLCFLCSQVEKASVTSCGLSDCHWFVKENVGGGEHYILQSVAQPGRYLSKTKQHKHYIFTLSANITEGAQVTDKMIQKEVCFCYFYQCYFVLYLFCIFHIVSTFTNFENVFPV